MGGVEALCRRVGSYNPGSDSELIRRAYAFADAAHAGQERTSGEPYITHPLAVAGLLADMRLDDASIATALLHDVAEDTDRDLHAIEAGFGAEIAGLVDGVTKLTRLSRVSREQAQAENFRKLLLAMSRDARVLLIKLSDRLHNMRTIGSLDGSRRERIARETMDVYAPLAGRMGMQQMREELEDLAFRALQPAARFSIMRRFVSLRRAHGDIIPEVEGLIRGVLRDASVVAEVTGRQKRPFSIWRKMEAQGVSFEQLSDVVAFRIATVDIETCYRALGAVHRAWRAVPGRFKDYISGPKANGYRSIHTTVMAPGGLRIEIQIRTRDMHEIAESGLAAHWAYKDGMRTANRYAVDPYRWLRELVEGLERGDTPQEFLEHAKLDMYHDQVFCFTPKGAVKGLPRGATALDFAYAIHTVIGSTCVAAKADGRRIPIGTPLRNGQTVEILTSTNQRPTWDWLSMAVTGRARAAIKRAARERELAEYARLGEDILREHFTRMNAEWTPGAIGAASGRLGSASINDLFASVGRGERLAGDVFAAVYPERSGTAGGADAQARPTFAVRGLRRQSILSYCTTCYPLPGERIIAIPEKGKGVCIHAIDCVRVAADEANAENWIDVRWAEGEETAPSHVAGLSVTIVHEAGALGAVCTAIGGAGANIHNIRIVDRKPDFYRLWIEVEVRDVKHLATLARLLRERGLAHRVERLRDNEMTEEDVRDDR